MLIFQMKQVKGRRKADTIYCLDGLEVELHHLKKLCRQMGLKCLSLVHKRYGVLIAKDQTDDFMLTLRLTM